MNRWKGIKAFLLWTVAIAILGAAVWQAHLGDTVRLVLILAFGMPTLFWAIWNALYEDKLDSGAPPSAGERVMHSLWVWARRLVFGAIALCLAVATVFGLVGWWAGNFGLLAGAIVCAMVSFMSAWTAVFGAGRNRSMGDDRKTHLKRMRRYE